MPNDRMSRLEARLPGDVYATLKQAAELSGRTLSDFVVSAAHKAARETIEEHTIMRVSAGDQRRFADALLNPPAPSAALRRAKRLHAEQVEIK